MSFKINKLRIATIVRCEEHGVPAGSVTSRRTSYSSNVQQLGEAELAVDKTRRLDEVPRPDDCLRVL